MEVNTKSEEQQLIVPITAITPAGIVIVVDDTSY